MTLILLSALCAGQGASVPFPGESEPVLLQTWLPLRARSMFASLTIGRQRDNGKAKSIKTKPKHRWRPRLPAPAPLHPLHAAQHRLNSTAEVVFFAWSIEMHLEERWHTKFALSFRNWGWNPGHFTLNCMPTHLLVCLSKTRSQYLTKFPGWLEFGTFFPQPSRGLQV